MLTKVRYTLLIGMWVITSNVFAVMVDGYCFLENQFIHQGIRIRFIEVYPGTGGDTTYTDSTGYYQVELTAGVYNIYYHHYGYVDEENINQFIVTNTTLPNNTLMEREYLLSGELSGVLDSACWLVTGNISVQAGDSLVILPGTSLLFDGNYSFSIHGCLRAMGQEGDSIKFMPASSAITWGQIYFTNSTGDSNRLEYCLITGTYETGVHIANSNVVINHCNIRGNPEGEDDCVGIYIGAANPVITNCIISDNTNHGICCYSSSPLIDNCDITGNRNEDNWYGGGIVCYNSSPVISNCTISENYADEGGGIYLSGNGNPYIVNCTIKNNQAHHDGAGIWASDSCYATIEDCTIKENFIEFSGGGGGICCTEHGDVTIRRCLISDNSIYVWGNGVGVYCYKANPIIDRCTIVNNTDMYYGAEGAVYCHDSSPRISNTIVANNTCLGGVFFYNNHEVASISYSCFYNNQSGNFVNPPLLGLGELAAVNSNGDSCDIFYNIFLNPQFVNPQNGDYHLISTSPCIDAGDPESPLDPDSTIADIGAFYYNQSTGIHPHSGLSLPSSVQVLTNYPNPFNNTTVLDYNLPMTANVRLIICNVLGQCVEVLFDGRQQAGEHRITWDARDVASGIYFARLQSGKQVKTIKMVLLK